MNRDLWQKTGRVKKIIGRKILDKFEVPAIGLVFHMAWIGLGNFRLITKYHQLHKQGEWPYKKDFNPLCAI